MSAFTVKKAEYKFKSLLIALVTMGCISSAQANIYYVKSGAANGNGSSWSKAFNNLDSALDAARASSGPDQIWVAAGTYKPLNKYGGTYNGTEDNLKTFKLPSNVNIYGGFAGYESSPDRRNCDANKTILSGDLASNDINDPNNIKNFKADNAWHVLTADGVTGVTLDGMTVRDGYANGPDKGTSSGDPDAVPRDQQFNIRTLDYTHAAGGGLLVRHGSQVTLNNMRFEYNAADESNAKLRSNPALGSPAIASGGGAVAAEDENTLVTIKNSVFDHNSALNLGSNGGALSAVVEGSFNVSTSSFTNNIANRIGGAIHGKNGNNIKVVASQLKNNIITGTAIGDESGGGIGTINTNLTVSASYFDSNVSSLTAGGGAILFHQPFNDSEAYTMSVDSSLFNNNNAGVIGGGAINILANIPNPGTKGSITNCAFTNNTGGVGGAVYMDTIPVVISNSAFIGNNAWVQGGAIFGSNLGNNIFNVTDLSARGLLKISNSLFKNNAIVGLPATVPPPSATPPNFEVFVFNFFSTALSSIFGQSPAGVNDMNPGGGAIAVEMGGNVNISGSTFISNNTPNGYGGALLVGGAKGFSGTNNLGTNQAYATLSNSACSGNTATLGGNNTAVRDPANIGGGLNGVTLIKDGSCQ